MSSFLVFEVSAISASPLGYYNQLRLFWWLICPRELGQCEDPEHIFRSVFCRISQGFPLKSWQLKCLSHLLIFLSPLYSFLYSYWHVSLFPPKKFYKRRNNNLNLSLPLCFCFPVGWIPFLALTIICRKSSVSSRGLALAASPSNKQKWAGRHRHSGRTFLWGSRLGRVTAVCGSRGLIIRGSLWNAFVVHVSLLMTGNVSNQEV